MELCGDFWSSPDKPRIVLKRVQDATEEESETAHGTGARHHLALPAFAA